MKTTLLALVAFLCLASVSQAAGNVAVTNSGPGLLIVSGADNLDNSIAITGGDVAASGGTVVVEALDDTLLNGKGLPVSFPNIRAVAVNMKGGADHVIIKVKCPQYVNVEMGAGQDTAVFEDTECKSIKGSCGYFPGPYGQYPSGINDTYESFSYTNVKTIGDIVTTVRGMLHLANVESGNIISATNASGINGVGLGEGSTTEGTGLKCKNLQLTFGRGNDTLTLSDCQVSVRFVTIGNFGEDTLTRSEFTAPSEWIYEFEHVNNN